jgi:hypothetical protein
VRIQYAIACRYAEAQGGSMTIIGGGIDSFIVQTLPTPVGFMIGFRAVGLKEEFNGGMVNFHLHVASPEGSTVGNEIDTPLGPLLAPHAREEWPVGITFASAVQFVAEEEGCYEIRYRVDDHEDGLPIYILTSPPQPTP